MSNWKNINRDSLSPKDALEILIEGNKRFIHRGYKAGYENDYAKQVKQLIRE